MVTGHKTHVELAETGTAPIFDGLPDLYLELEETRLLDGRQVVID